MHENGSRSTRLVSWAKKHKTKLLILAILTALHIIFGISIATEFSVLELFL